VRFGSGYTLNADDTSATMPSTFDNLEAGYYYRISELDTMRYDLVQNGVKLTIGGTEQSGGTGNSTPVFELTDTLITDGTQITASFTNSRYYADYLSDTDVAVNTLSYKPPWPEASVPVVHTVTIGNNAIRVSDKGLIDLSDLTVNPKPNGDNQGAIGYYNDNGQKQFYPYTQITGSWTIVLY
jgi:hypothetical protein